MRVSDSTMFRQFLANLTAQNSIIGKSLGQISDLKRVRYASDDPAAARVSLAIRGELVRNEGYTRSANTAKDDLTTIDSTLDQIVNVLIATRGEATRFDAGGSATSTVVEVIDAARADILRFANTQQNGRYLFAGTNTLTPPFDDTGTYTGNAESTASVIGPDETIAVTVSGAEYLQGPAGDLFTTLSDLSTALTNGDDAGVLAGIDQLNAEIDHLIESRTVTGVRLERVTRAGDRLLDEKLALETRIIALEDADLAEAATQLAQASNSVEALSQAASRVLGRSLFDFLG